MTQKQIIDILEGKRKEYNITIDDLCLASGIKVRNYYRYKNHKQNINYKALNALCDTLGIQIKLIITEEHGTEKIN